MEFVGKVVIVTGASSGIGAGTAELFAEKGASVVLVGRNENNLSKVFNKCCQFATKNHLSIVADLDNSTDVERVIKQTITKFNRLDILVNNAGNGVFCNVEDIKMEDFDKVMNLNLRSVVQLTNLACPFLIQSKGCIVNVSSNAGLNSFDNCSIYCTSKAALDMFTKCAALDLAKKGVRVNSVNPAVVVTDFHRRAGMSEDQYRVYLKKCKELHPIGRVGQPREVAEAIAYLASDSASFITGVLLPMTGGKHLCMVR